MVELRDRVDQWMTGTDDPLLQGVDALPPNPMPEGLNVTGDGGRRYDDLKIGV